MKRFIISFCLMIAAFSASAQVQQMLGDWVNIDDKTGQELVVVNIYKASNGKYYGKIIEMLVPGTENDRCVLCEGDLKDKPVLGMMIVYDMVEKDGILQGGKVLDPDNGKFYYAKISLDNGRLKLRGSIDKWGALGRSQYWRRK